MAWDRKAKRDARNYADRAERVAFEIGYGHGWDGMPMQTELRGWPKTEHFNAYDSGYYEGTGDRAVTHD